MKNEIIVPIVIKLDPGNVFIRHINTFFGASVDFNIMWNILRNTEKEQPQIFVNEM